MDLADLEDGPLRARYALEGKIGRGGMGVIAEANDRRIGRHVAIKRLAGQPTPELVARFVHEARIQGRLDHPAILPVYDLGIQSDGRPYFAMRKVTGATLADILAQGDHDAWPRRRLLEVVVDVCLALAHAHARGIVHRDLKPANVMVGDDGGVYVLDWGVAAEIGSVGDAGAGTVGYMAPEQDVPSVCDPVADVFALGKILREVHEGELDEVCARATANNPAARYPGARELADAVLAYLDADLDADLARKEAAVHLAKARAADTRAESMREAGLALALDPSSAEAGEIVGRLLLEPPASLPPEVQRELDEQDEAMIRTRGRAAAVSYIGIPLFLPLYLIQGVRDWALVLALPAICAVLAYTALTATRGALPRARLWIGVGGNLILLLILGRVCGPFVIPPAMAVLVAMIVCTHPRLRSWWLVAGILALGPVGAWALERAGVLAPTVLADGDHLALGSTMVDLPAVATVVSFGLFIVTLVATGARFGHRIAAAHHSARRALAVQAWHLRGLIGRRRS